MADATVYVAMRPGLDSFNVSVTAGLLLYEARRQRA
jgi:tRNA G18 (ribose-2'-O)-methylase SpoU